MSPRLFAHLLVATAVGSIGLGVFLKHREQSEVPRDDKSKYYFTLPLMFLGCMNYQVHSGDTFKGWHLYQWIVLDASEPGTHDVMIQNVHWHGNWNSAFDCPTVRAPA